MRRPCSSADSRGAYAAASNEEEMKTFGLNNGTANPLDFSTAFHIGASSEPATA
jgi:hypothetical protein